MAKTRPKTSKTQARKKTTIATKIEKKPKLSKNLKIQKKSTILKECFIRLDRMDMTEYRSVIEQPVTKKLDARKEAKLLENVKFQNDSPVLKECFVRLDRMDMTKYRSSIEQPVTTKYKLRERTVIDETLKKLPRQPKPINQIVALSQAALYTSKAVRIWEQIKKVVLTQKIQIKVNDIVCGRMAGHRPWPSKVVEFKRNGTQLHFFGSHDIGLVKKIEIVPIELCKEMIDTYLQVPVENLHIKTLSYHMSFIKAVREISSNFNNE